MLDDYLQFPSPAHTPFDGPQPQHHYTSRGPATSIDVDQPMVTADTATDRPVHNSAYPQPQPQEHTDSMIRHTFNAYGVPSGQTGRHDLGLSASSSATSASAHQYAYDSSSSAHAHPDQRPLHRLSVGSASSVSSGAGGSSSAGPRRVEMGGHRLSHGSASDGMMSLGEEEAGALYGRPGAVRCLWKDCNE